MKHHTLGNYLKAHRRQSGLSQRDVGKLLGHHDGGHVSRHERSRSVPTLANAIAYELIFRVPVAAIFVGTRDTIALSIEKQLQRLEADLQSRSSKDRNANLIAQKLTWLTERTGQ
jgi:transcriptional regulator with XRE-family HTH domain